MATSIPAPLPTSTQPTLWDSPNATSSPASVAGATPSDSPAGMTTDLFGPGAAPASPSRRQAPKLGATIRATFGRRGFSSSASADLTQSLVSRLKARLVTDGSTLFAMTWKEKATPSGRSVFRLAASGRRTSDSGCGSWPTPVAEPANGTPEAFLRRKRNAVAKGSSMGICLSDINMVAQLASWPSPMAGTPAQKGYNEAGSTDYERKVDTIMGLRETPNGPKVAWPTPKAEDSESTGAHRGTPDTLTSATRLSSWATPRAVTGGPESAERKQELGRMDSGGGDLQAQALGVTSSGSPAETAKPGQLNPAFSRWLMGYPAAWDSCGVTATRLSRKSPRKSSRRT